MHSYTFSEETPRIGIWRQTARSQGRNDGAEVAPCAWDPKMFSSWVGIPKGSVPAPKHHQVAGPERPAERVGGGGRGGGGSPCPAHSLLTHIKNPFRVIGWQGSSDFFFRACAWNTNQAASWLLHKLAPVTKKVIENEGSSAQLPVSRHHGGRHPDLQLVAPQKLGLQHPHLKQREFSLVSLREVV